MRTCSRLFKRERLLIETRNRHLLAGLSRRNVLFAVVAIVVEYHYQPCHPPSAARGLNTIRKAWSAAGW